MPAHDSYVGLTPLHVCPWLKLCCLSRSVLRQPHESSWLPIRVDARARTASPHEHWQSHLASRCPDPSRRTTASRPNCRPVSPLACREHSHIVPTFNRPSTICAQPRLRQFANEAATMAYNLATAALATGVNKSTILRAIKAGRLSATRDETGWTIEVAELHRVLRLCQPQPPSNRPCSRTQPRTSSSGCCASRCRPWA